VTYSVWLPYHSPEESFEIYQNDPWAWDRSPLSQRAYRWHYDYAQAQGGGYALFEPERFFKGPRLTEDGHWTDIPAIYKWRGHYTINCDGCSRPLDRWTKDGSEPTEEQANDVWWCPDCGDFTEIEE
jgi:hypothetical protein